jgi:hypothetical protein
MGGSLLMVERQAKQVQVHFPPPQGELTDTLPHASDEGQGFSQFISLFRKEMSMMQHQESRAAQFIPSIAAVSQMDATQKEAGDDIFFNNLHSPLGDGTEDRDDKPEDDYDYWPDFGLGIAQDERQSAMNFLSTSTTTTEEDSTPPTEDDESQDDSQDDLWPIELIMTSSA